MKKTLDKYMLQLQTFPACDIGLSTAGLTQYRKELIKVGKYVHPANNHSFEVTVDTLNHWVDMFTKWTTAGNHVPIPLGHSRVDNPKDNVGWVIAMSVEGKSLIGIMELNDPTLSLTTDVSICVESKVKDGKGVEYSDIITHVSLCTDPVIAGLGKFTKLSLSSGETNMEFLKKIGKALGIKEKEPTEELVLSALTDKIKPAEKKVELSQNISPFVKLLSKTRAKELSDLVKTGQITPAIKDVISAQYVEVKALALSTQNEVDDGYDLLYEVLKQNKPVKLDEVTGVQNLELANLSAVQPNAMQKEINKRRKAAGMEN